MIGVGEEPITPCEHNADGLNSLPIRNHEASPKKMWVMTRGFSPLHRPLSLNGNYFWQSLYAVNEIIGSDLEVDTTIKLASEGFKHPGHALLGCCG
jgi:hypothetical protein